MSAQSTGRGHRARAHTADVILEAWGPDLATCCEEAVAALVDTYATRPAATVIAERRIRLPAATVEELLVAVLEEVIFVLDTDVGVPVEAGVEATEDGGLELCLALVDAGQVEGTGAVPKAISRSGLTVTTNYGRVRCRVLVDL